MPARPRPRRGAEAAPDRGARLSSVRRAGRAARARRCRRRAGAPADARGLHERAGRSGDAPDHGARLLTRRDHEVVERPDLAREVDHGDRDVGPIELDPDRVGRLVVDAQAPLGAPAAVAHGVLDQRVGRQQATHDVGARLQGEPGRLGDRWPRDAAVRADEAQDDDLVVVLDAGEVGAGHRALDLEGGPLN